jgi:predicted permease
MWHMNPYTEVLAPLRAASYPYMVRLRSGVSSLVATERMTQLIRGRISTLPADFRVVLTPAQQAYIAAIRPVLWAVTAAAGLVLLIAGANVAVLMLVRGRRRQKELAIRLALGAGQLRIARLLVIEALVIGGLATVIGTISSRVATSSVAPAIERVLERRVPGGLDAFAMDGRVLLAACACGFLVTLVFALVPVIATWRSSIAPNLALSGRAMTDNTSSSRSRAVLIGVEVAASLTLLVGAALMAETAMRMLRVDFGIRPDNVMTASLALRQRSFPDPASRVAFYDRLLARLASLPGGSSVALGDWWPLQGSRPRRVETMGDTPVTGGANPFAVTSAYFDALGMSIRDGRAFTPADGLGSEPVAIISQSLAEQLWARTRAIGQRFTIHPDGAEEVQATPVVVGVVNDVRQSHSDTDLYDVYLPLAQRAGRFAFLYLQGTQSPTWETELRSAIASVDSGVAVGAPRSLAFGLEQERSRPRFLALLLAVFAAFATVLALVGMHGVIAYAVRQRQREIAVRIAIGADAGSVTRMFLRHGLVVLVAGIATGILGAIGLSQILQSQLHGVRPAEPRTLALAALTFAVCGLLAIWWPAWRAASTDPALVLKEE